MSLTDEKLYGPPQDQQERARHLRRAFYRFASDVERATDTLWLLHAGVVGQRSDIATETIGRVAELEGLMRWAWELADRAVEAEKPANNGGGH